MTALEFMAQVQTSRRGVGAPIATPRWYWQMWSRYLRLLKVLADDANLANELSGTSCFSQSALRKDAGWFRGSAVRLTRIDVAIAESRQALAQMSRDLPTTCEQ